MYVYQHHVSHCVLPMKDLARNAYVNYVVNSGVYEGLSQSVLAAEAQGLLHGVCVCVCVCV